MEALFSLCNNQVTIGETCMAVITTVVVAIKRLATTFDFANAKHVCSIAKQKFRLNSFFRKSSPLPYLELPKLMQIKPNTPETFLNYLKQVQLSEQQYRIDFSKFCLIFIHKLYLFFQGLK